MVTRYMGGLRAIWLVVQCLIAALLCLAVVVGLWAFSGMNQHG